MGSDRPDEFLEYPKYLLKVTFGSTLNDTRRDSMSIPPYTQILKQPISEGLALLLFRGLKMKFRGAIFRLKMFILSPQHSGNVSFSSPNHLFFKISVIGGVTYYPGVWHLFAKFIELK